MQKQIDNTKSTQERSGFEKDLRSVDNEFLANEKIKNGNMFINKNDYVTALEYFKEAIELNPNSASAYYGSAYCYGQMDDFVKERQNLSRAIQIKPKFYQAYYMRGVSWGAEDAMSHHDIRKELEDARLKNDAWKKRKQEIFLRAKREIADYSSAININPNFAEAYISRGSAYVVIGNYNLAIMDLEKGIELGVNDKYIMSWAEMSLKTARTSLERA